MNVPLLPVHAVTLTFLHVTFSVFITEEFNSKILTPELSDKELEKLHTDLKEMYRNYCAPQAHDKIQFDDDIVSQLKESKIFHVFCATLILF